jgi:hypothetical protein
MKVSEAYPSDFLKAVDIGNNQVRVLISHVEMRDLGDDEKPVVFFQNKKKGVVLNVTNANAIAQYYGDDMDLWAGKPIVLFTMMVSFQGRMQPGIRVRIPGPGEGGTAPAPKPAPVQQSENPAMDDEVPF